MLRSLRFGLIALAASAVSSGVTPAAAQTFTLPELGLQNSGACPELAVRERTGKTMVSVGCVDGTAKTIRWKGEGSGISLTPSTTAATGTLARLMADRAPLANPSFVDTAIVSRTTAGAPGCTSTDGSFATDGTQSWEPSCFGSWLASASPFFVFPTRGTDKNADGSPKRNGTATALIQARSVGDQPLQRTGQFINMDVVGAPYSHNKKDNQTNTVGQLISVRQRPDASGNAAPYTWAQNLDMHIAPNAGQTHSYLVEADLNNFNRDSSFGAPFISAYYFYGGINPYPNLALHYFGNPATEKYEGTATTSGNTFTLASGRFSPLITKLSYAGSTYRVDCTTTACVADRPVGNSSTPGAFVGRSSMVHVGLLFQDSDGGSQVQDHNFMMSDSARAIMTANGNHRIGLDFTQDAMPYAALLKGGQQVCYNGTAMCMSYSGGLNSLLLSPSNDPNAQTFRVDGGGNVTMAGTLTANGNVSTGGYFAAGVAGVSCNGPPTNQFQVVNGIVTRC